MPWVTFLPALSLRVLGITRDRAVVLNLSAPGMDFVEDNFSTSQGGVEGWFPFHLPSAYLLLGTQFPTGLLGPLDRAEARPCPAESFGPISWQLLSHSEFGNIPEGSPVSVLGAGAWWFLDPSRGRWSLRRVGHSCWVKEAELESGGCWIWNF